MQGNDVSCASGFHLQVDADNDGVLEAQELADAFQRRRADVMVKLKYQDFWLWLKDYRQTQPCNPRQKSAIEVGRKPV